MRAAVSHMLVWGISAVLVACSSARVERADVPYIDAHSHIATDLAPDEVIARLRRAGLAGVVIMHPDPPALQDIAQRNPGFVVPFISVSRTPDATGLRLNDETASSFARLYEAGAVCGFGELPTRLVPNPEPSDAAAVSNRFRQQIFDLADARGVPVNIHVSLETPEVIAAVEDVVTSHPRMPLVLAHAGWMAGPDVIGPLLDAHPNLYVDLSVRLDPAVGGVLAPGAVNKQSILTPEGELQPAWRALIGRFPERFLFGLDVTGADRPQHIDELMAVARRALGTLPRDIEASVAHANGERLLRGCRLAGGMRTVDRLLIESTHASSRRLRD